MVKNLGKVMKAWKTIEINLQLQHPKLVDSIKQLSMWWGTTFRGREYKTSIARSQEMYKASLQSVGDLWNPNLKRLHQ